MAGHVQAGQFSALILQLYGLLHVQPVFIFFAKAAGRTQRRAQSNVRDGQGIDGQIQQHAAGQLGLCDARFLGDGAAHVGGHAQHPADLAGIQNAFELMNGGLEPGPGGLGQDQDVYKRQILDNVLFGLEIQRAKTPENVARAQRLLETYGLAEFAQKYPRQLSGGMRQRLSLIHIYSRMPL